jgi:AhpD family alkylhydroperoxidase
MHSYPIHTIASAPEKSRQALAGLAEAVGLVPNLAATMAGSPPLVNGFAGVFGQLAAGSFGGAERQVLLLANAVANRCAWAVAFHSTLALREGVAPDDVAALRQGGVPAEPRRAALATLTRALIEQRGHLADAEVDAFTRAGFTPEQVLEAIAALAASVMANYAGNLAQPPLEPAFRAQAWAP